MMRKFSKYEDSELGEPVYIISESKLVKFMIFIGGIVMGIWVPYSYFFLDHIWTYGIFFAELPGLIILMLSGGLLLVGVSSLWSMQRKSEIQIFQNGLLINGEKIYYKDIISMKVTRSMFVKIFVQTLEKNYIYTASIFSNKDQKEINKVIDEIRK